MNKHLSVCFSCPNCKMAAPTAESSFLYCELESSGFLIPIHAISAKAGKKEWRWVKQFKIPDKCNFLLEHTLLK